ncbi:MAG: hypothetical protein M3Q79_01735 [bacterium]|nr:hypothetical protein [bacterium]
MNKLKAGALAAVTVWTTAFTSDESSHSLFKEASHIPPAYCSDQIAKELGGNVMQAIIIDLHSVLEADPATPTDNQRRAARLPPPPPQTLSVSRYTKEHTWEQQKAELPDSGIILNVSSNIQLAPIDTAGIDTMVKTSLSFRSEENILQNATYDCMHRLIYEHRVLSSHEFNLIYLNNIVIRDNLAVDRTLGSGSVGGRYANRNNTIYITAGENTDTNLVLAHELEHGLRDALDIRGNSEKKREFSAVQFELAALDFTSEYGGALISEASTSGNNLMVFKL